MSAARGRPGVNRCIVVATGLAREASIARADGGRCAGGGGNAQRLAGLVEAEFEAGAAGVMSFGIAGALTDDLAPGKCVVARAVVAGETRIVAHPAWTANIARSLSGALLGEVAGQDAIAATSHEKRALHERTGAAVVDNESHVVAELARAHGIPFAVLRVVSDPANRALPHAACVGLTASGRPDVLAVLRALVAAPGEIVPLARTGFDAARALRALSAARRRLGARLGYPNLGELVVDVA